MRNDAIGTGAALNVPRYFAFPPDAKHGNDGNDPEEHRGQKDHLNRRLPRLGSMVKNDLKE